MASNCIVTSDVLDKIFQVVDSELSVYTDYEFIQHKDKTIWSRLGYLNNILVSSIL